MKTGLDKIWKIVVLCGADKAGDTHAGQRAAARVKVVQQHLKSIRVKFNDGKISLEELIFVHFLGICAHTQSGYGLVGSVEILDAAQLGVPGAVQLTRPLALIVTARSLQLLFTPGC